jgi:hypothetical protein
MSISTVFADTTAEKKAKTVRIRNKEGNIVVRGLLCVFASLMIILAGQSFANDEVRGKCTYKTQGKQVFYKCTVLTAGVSQSIHGANKGGK